MGFIQEKIIEVSRFGFIKVECEISVKMKKMVVTCEELNINRVCLSLPEFLSAAIFLRLGLPSTLIRHENRAFGKLSSDIFINAGFAFYCRRE